MRHQLEVKSLVTNQLTECSKQKGCGQQNYKTNF